jgi:hypothetical protein
MRVPPTHAASTVTTLRHLVAGPVRDVAFAIAAQDAAVCVHHGQRVEVGVVGTLEEADLRRRIPYRRGGATQLAAADHAVLHIATTHSRPALRLYCCGTRTGSTTPSSLASLDSLRARACVCACTCMRVCARVCSKPNTATQRVPQTLQQSSASSFCPRPPLHGRTLAQRRGPVKVFLQVCARPSTTVPQCWQTVHGREAVAAC